MTFTTTWWSSASALLLRGITCGTPIFGIWELEEIKSRAVKASEDWDGRERFLTTYLPSQELEAAGFGMNRRGRFLSYVVDAKRERLISEDTAALFLGIDGSMLHEVEQIRDEFF